MNDKDRFIPETITIDGHTYRVVAASEPPPAEELAMYVRAIANAKERITTIEDSLADLNQKERRLRTRLGDAELELRLARTRLTIRSEGYGLTADEQGIPRAAVGILGTDPVSLDLLVKP